MSLVFKANGATVATEAVKVLASNPVIPGGVQGLPSTAWYCEISTATIIVDDPEGIYSFSTWMVWTADEPACVGKERVFTGWIFRWKIRRGGYREGMARVWELEIVDQNEAASLQPFRSKTANRPAETDLVRIAFILDSQPMHWTPVEAGTLTNLSTNPRDLSDANYVKQYPVEAFTSIASSIGKQVFIFWNHDEARLELFYGFDDERPLSSLKISNEPGDANGTDVFAPFLDSEFESTGEKRNTGELLDYIGGSVFQERQATIDDLSPTPLSPDEFRREYHRSSDRIGKVTTANAVAAADIEQMATDDQTIRCMVQLPAEVVNEIDSGMAIDVKFVHFPGMSDYVTMPIIRSNKVPTVDRTDLYDVTLELSSKQKLRDVDTGTPPSEFPPKNPCDIADVVIVQNAHASVTSPATGSMAGASWPAPPTPGNVLLMAWLANGVGNTDPGDFPDWTPIQVGEAMLGIGGAGGTISTYWKIATADEATTPTSDVGSSNYAAGGLNTNNAYLIEVAGVDALDDHVIGHANGTTNLPVGVTITPTADRVAFLMTFLEYNTSAGGPATPKAGVTELYEESGITGGGNPVRWIGYMAVADTTGSYDVNPTLAGTPDWVSVTVALYCSGGTGETCPAQGQWTDWFLVAEGDGVTSQFTLDCPYADGGLLVQVNSVPITIGLTETDPAAGVFDLDFAPLAAEGDRPAEQVWVKFQGR